MDGIEGDVLAPVEEDRRAFEVERGGVSILNPDGRILRQKVPEGVNPTSFRHILASVDLIWNDSGVFPGPEQAREVWPSIPLKTWQTVFASPEFESAMEKRGVPVPSNHGLSEKQIVALQVLTNPSDTRTIASKLKDIGVAYSTYQNWMRHPLFSRMYRERAERLLSDSIPTAITGLVANLEKGDQRAIEFHLKMSGRYDPSQTELQNARTVVLALVESIQKHAPKEVREAIENDLDAIMTGIKIDRAMKEIG